MNSQESNFKAIESTNVIDQNQIASINKQFSEPGLQENLEQAGYSESGPGSPLDQSVQQAQQQQQQQQQQQPTKRDIQRKQQQESAERQQQQVKKQQQQLQKLQQAKQKQEIQQKQQIKQQQMHQQRVNQLLEKQKQLQEEINQHKEIAPVNGNVESDSSEDSGLLKVLKEYSTVCIIVALVVGVALYYLNEKGFFKSKKGVKGSSPSQNTFREVPTPANNRQLYNRSGGNVPEMFKYLFNL
jgi:hypothetical protein